MRRISRSSLIAVLVSIVLFASACSQDNDPDTWAEAGNADNVASNFERSCLTANEDGGMSEDEARAYCECVWPLVVDFYGGEINDDGSLNDKPLGESARTFEDFVNQEKALRSTPEDVPADLVALFGTCPA